MGKRGSHSGSSTSLHSLTENGTTKLLIKDEGYKPATYRQMLRYADFWDYFLLSPGLVFAVLDGISAPFGSIIFRGITDVLMAGQAAYASGNFDLDEFSAGIIHFCLLYFLQGLNMFVLTILAMGCFHSLSERLSYKIKENYFKAILAQDQEWFDRHDVGSLTQLMTAGIDKIRHGTSDKLVVVIKSCMNLISGMAFAFYFSWELTLVILAMSPFLVMSMHFSHKMLITQTKKEAAAYSICGGIAEEVLSAIKTVISFNGQLFELKRYSESLNEAQKVGFRKALIVSLCTGLYGIINFVAMGIGFYYGTCLVFKHQISPGTVFGVFWAVFIGLMRFGMALPQLPTLLKARVSAGEIFSIIDCKPQMKLGGQLCPKAVEGRIELKNIHFRYPTRPEVKVLNGISLEIEPGQNIALVGHSGCGKSTIISLLMRYYQQESGCITLDGIPLEDLNIEWLRSTIGIVSQEPVLFQTTVAENLKMGKSDLTRQEMEDACKMANAHEFIVKLENGYDTIIGDGGIRLSGGQKQRLAIARALVRQPKILLLDEATSALDTESERIVQDALDHASSGRTTITIAHRLSTVKNADKIIVFENGRIIEHGTHEQLFSNINGFYRQLVLSQQINVDIEEEFDTIEHELHQQSSPRIRISTTSSNDSFSNHQLDDQKEELLPNSTVKSAGICQILKFADMKLFSCGLFLSLIRGCSWPVFAILYGIFFRVMSDPLHSTAENMLYFATGGFFILGLLSGFTTWLSGNILGIVGEKLNVRLRISVYKNLLRHNASYFDDPNHSVGKLTTRLATDSNNVQAAVDQRLADVLQGLTSFFAGIAVAVYFGYQMALFCMTISGIFILIQYFISKAVKKRAQHDTTFEESEARLSCEFIANVKTIQSLTQETKICRRFEETSKGPFKRAIVRGWLMSCILAIGAGFVSFNFAASYLVGLLMIRLGYCSPFTVFQVIEALNIATIMVMATVSFFPEYSRAKTSAALIFHMLAEEPEIDNFSATGSKPEIQGNVQLSNVDFSYPNSRQILTLKKMSIKSKFGQTIAIVGPSGCGKSTIIQLIERFYDILGGMIRIDGRDIRQINIRHLRSNIALVGQEPTLFNLSIRENISYGLDYDVSIEKIKSAAKLANIDKFIESLPEQYDTLVGGRGSQLSGGQRQRIAIARAIIREPKILLLDEATAALDGESEKLVQEALDRARYGRTCLVVAHRLSTIQNADLICVLDNGKCIEFGNHQQLLSRKGLYAKLVEKQSI